jgi:hypothetical protein
MSEIQIHATLKNMSHPPFLLSEKTERGELDRIGDFVVAQELRIIFFGSFPEHQERLSSLYEIWKEGKTPSQAIVTKFCDDIIEDGKTFLTKNNILGHFARLKRHFERKLEFELETEGGYITHNFFQNLGQELAAYVAYAYVQEKNPDIPWKLVTGLDMGSKQVFVEIASNKLQEVSLSEISQDTLSVFVCPQYFSEVLQTAAL